MSDSESDDFEGFESAEEDLQLSDLDGDEVDVTDRLRTLSNGQSKELGESNPTLVSDKHDPVLLVSPDKRDVSSFPIKSELPKRKLSNSADNVQNLCDNVENKNISISGDNNEVLDNKFESNKTINSFKINESDILNAKTDSKDEVSACQLDASLSRTTSENNQPPKNLIDNKPFIESFESMTISNKTKSEDKRVKTVDSGLEGWDFEDDDIDLPISPEEDNTSSLLSTSSAKSNSNISHPKERNLGDIPFITDDSGVGNSPSGWDFEDDFDFPVTPVKKIEPLKDVNAYRLDSSAIEPQNTVENPVWSSWGGWGVTNLISSAGVSTLTQMTSGLTSMLENTLGAPDPQVLASQLSSNNESELKSTENVSKEQNPSESLPVDIFGLGNIIGGVKHLGNKVIDGSLETLETLGKKTMEVLQEGDPGLKKKRALLFQSDKVILSQVLRDAKEKAEASEQEHHKVSRKAQYETLFDDFHGLVHLEALEMISRQCEIKMQSVLSNRPKCSHEEFYESINLVKQLYEHDEYKDEDEKQTNENLQDVLTSCLDTLSLNVNIKNFVEVDVAIQSRLKQTFVDGTDIHSNAISDLAQFTACSIELFHRIAELFIVKDINDIENDFKALSRVGSVSKSKIGMMSESYSAKLMLLPEKSTSPLITNIFLEASNSSTYLDNAFELFAPILQLKALQNEMSHN